MQKPNKQAIADAIRLIVGPGQVTELRALEASLDGKWPATYSGYFDDADKLADAVGTIRTAKGIYFTPNPVDPDLIARAANRIRKTPKGESTQDTNIVSRKWLLVDVDSQRASGISASQAELDAAVQRARDVFSWLRGEGWPDPICAQSGNGAHLMYRIDLPAEDDGVVQNCLVDLAARFDDDAVKVDTSVFNPSRIWKLYGTWACKGDSTEERPHRIAKVTFTPSEVVTVSDELLSALSKQAPAPEQPTLCSRQTGGHLEAFDVPGFLQRHGLEVDGPHDFSGKQGKGIKWTFRISPMCDHDDDGPHLIQHASGAVTAGCHHNSCSWTWTELRALFDPKQEYSHPPIESYGEPPAKESTPDAQPTEAPVRKTTTLEAAASDYLQQVREDRIKLLSLGLPDVDYALGGGVGVGEIIIIAARPSHGKSAVALQCIHSMTSDGMPVLLISEEMSALILGKRSIEFASEVPSEHWKTSADQVEHELGLHFEKRAPCLIVESCGTASTACEVIRRAVEHDKIELAVVDYAQLLKGKGYSSYDQLTDTCQQLVGTARQCGITLMLLCQLNRKMEERSTAMPMMSDLKGSGQFEQDADVILFLDWPHKRDSTKPANEYKIYVAKNKNRPTHSPVIDCRFEPSRQRLMHTKISEHPRYTSHFDAFNQGK